MAKLAKRKSSGGTKFGWCMTGHHSNCFDTYTASMSGKLMECHCDCHGRIYEAEIEEVETDETEELEN